MHKALLAVALGVSCLTPALAAQRKTAKPAAPAPTLQDLIVQNKTREALRLAGKSPALVPAAVKAILDAADLQITERRIADARAAVEGADRFCAALAKAGKVKGVILPTDAIQGRLARIAGIELADNRQYSKAETKLREALDLSKKANDPVLEAGVHNNLGVALRNVQSGSDERVEEAAKEFDLARKMAEEQKDLMRAGSYNFNLGQVMLQLGRPGAALEAFTRSADQNKAAANSVLQARAIMFQGVSLSRIDAVSSEPMKYFDAAHKMFVGSGDDQNAGWTLFLMADHLAYGSKNTEAAAAAERAVPFLVKANDKAGLRRCYTLLGDMYGRLENKAKSESYKQKAAELSAGK